MVPYKSTSRLYQLNYSPTELGEFDRIESVNHLLDLKWQSLLNSSFSSRGMERKTEGNQSTNITLIFTRPVDLFLIPYFRPISANS